MKRIELIKKNINPIQALEYIDLIHNVEYTILRKKGIQDNEHTEIFNYCIHYLENYIDKK